MRDLYRNLKETINDFDFELISNERKLVLKPLISVIQEKVNAKQVINLNFICTHNSRRSHLAQIWAQTAAFCYKIDNVLCFSGGTEATAMYHQIEETLKNQGFKIEQNNETKNPKYHIKFSENSERIIAFSKVYDDDFNPKDNFTAILTCSQADEDCPFIAGADFRIPITYNDPKAFDNSEQKAEKYTERSLQIATEMFYVFSQIKN
jgi:arsenate reductase (thioredoxin)